MAGDLKLDTSFSSARGAFPYIAAALAILTIAGIVIVMTTDVAATLLPMNEQYADVLVPTAADGSPALSLQTLTQQEKGKTLTVDGSLINRTEAPINGLLAVVQVKDKYTLPADTVEVPIEPSELPAQGKGSFHAAVTIGEKGLSGYDVQFKLPDGGPFVPHKDDHPLVPTPEIKQTK